MSFTVSVYAVRYQWLGAAVWSKQQASPPVLFNSKFPPTLFVLTCVQIYHLPVALQKSWQQSQVSTHTHHTLSLSGCSYPCTGRFCQSSAAGSLSTCIRPSFGVVDLQLFNQHFVTFHRRKAWKASIFTWAEENWKGKRGEIANGANRLPAITHSQDGRRIPERSPDGGQLERPPSRLGYTEWTGDSMVVQSGKLTSITLAIYLCPPYLTSTKTDGRHRKVVRLPRPDDPLRSLPHHRLRPRQAPPE